MKKIALLLVVILLLSGCTIAHDDTLISQSQDTSTLHPPSVAEGDTHTSGMLAPFGDVRGNMFVESIGEYVKTRVLTPNEYNPDDMYTYQFNEYTVFSGNEELQQKIMENGKNPGLGIRALHDRGITGQGVTVAIIDQELSLEPPEFSGKIVEYYKIGNIELGTSSMHGAAVTSILAGETTGVAPGVDIYYVAVPTRIEDATYFADGLKWIIEKNKTLSEEEQIRLVSVSGNPSGVDSTFSNQELWNEAVARAQAAGILVIDCRVDADTGFVEHGHYDYNEPDNIENARNGTLSYGGVTGPTMEGYISVPCDYRTTVEQYDTGDYYYRYGGTGGLSWGIPYAAGVLALGWQINPQLTGEEIKQLLIESAYENEYGERIIYPAAFIEMVENSQRCEAAGKSEIRSFQNRIHHISTSLVLTLLFFINTVT